MTHEFEQASQMDYVVKKYAVYVPVPDELAMDLGLIPDTREPVTYPRRVRIRRWMWEKVAIARYRLGSWIAGDDLRDYDD